MNIFFTGSVRGGRANQPRFALIVKALSERGTVASQYVADKALSQFGETQLSGKEIRDREMAAMEAADVVVAEVTAPSLGVGYLIARATAAGKKVVALYCGDSLDKLSGIVKGDDRVEIHAYRSAEDIGKALDQALG